MVVKKNTKNNKFWIGIEQEGKYKGLKTLFIVGNKSIRIIKKVLLHNDEHKITHLYFGAGNQSKVTNFDAVEYFSGCKFQITLEVLEQNLKDIPIHILYDDNIYIVVTFKNKYLTMLKDTDGIKVEDNNNVWISTLKNMINTNKNIAYKGDIRVTTR